MCNPAEQAAQAALEQMFLCIRERRSFVFEAGAGAGKTYSLHKAIKYIINDKGKELIRKKQKIACITFTNVAQKEIEKEIDNHPAVLAETIHSFCWSLMQNFQNNIRSVLPTISEKWQERIEEAGENIAGKKIVYDLGYPKITDTEILLHHNDIPFIMSRLLEEAKFRKIFVQKFPILLIDEYQDTDKDFADSLIRNFVDTDTQSDLLIGFYGDYWQKIYGTRNCGEIESQNIVRINKEANFRSALTIVNCLNRMRPELPQNVSNLAEVGSVNIYHTNNFLGNRRTGQNWADDLPAEVAVSCLENLKEVLGESGWGFSPSDTKILMLTHNVIAQRQGYEEFRGCFSSNDEWTKKENIHFKFIADVIEPVCSAYENRKYGDMFDILDKRTISINSHADKENWRRDINALLILRDTANIGEVIDLLKRTQKPRLPEKVEIKEQKLTVWLENPEVEITEENKKSLEKLQRIRNVRYIEAIAARKFIEEQTPFATNHGVKGAEFDNVLVVIGRGWNQYNFNQMLEWANNGIPNDKEEAFERNRNLFYVACSRPKKKLAILFTQKLSEQALGTLGNWFGTENIHSLNCG